MVHRSKRRIIFAVLLPAVLLPALLLPATLALVAGCATAPPATVQGAEAYLVPDQSVYFGVNVGANRELVSYVAGVLGAEIDVIVNRVDLFGGSLDLSAADDLGFSGVALGRFPQGATRFALWKDREFRRAVAEKDTTGDRLVYYRQVGGPLEVAVPEQGIILGSTDSVVSLARAVGSGHGRLDAGIVERIRSVGGTVLGDPGPDIVIVFPEPSRLLGELLGLDLPRFPILRLSLAMTVRKAEDAAPDDPAAQDSATAEAQVPAVRLELAGDFEFSSEIQAALFGRLGRVFILGFVRALGLEATNLRDTVAIETDGRDVRFRGVPMSPDDLIRLATRLAGREQ